MSVFDGQSVLITGAASGIGLQMATQFAELGATVFAADLDPSGVPDGITGLRVDVTDEGAVQGAVQRVLNDTGRLDVLCNNAGIGSTTDPLTCTADEWERVFAVNSRGVFLGIKYALPPMLDRGYGVIVNTASVAGQVGLPNRTAYCASKGAVIALTRQVAVQYAGTGVGATASARARWTHPGWAGCSTRRTIRPRCGPPWWPDNRWADSVRPPR